MPDEKPIQETICNAALELAGERGWANVTLKDIAIRSDLSLAAVYAVTSSKLDVLTEIQRELDRQTRMSVETPDPGDAPRDRIFDVVMVSLETLEPYRHGIESIYRGLMADPMTAVLLLPTFQRAMRSMAELSGLASHGLKGRLTADGLGLIWLNTFRVWLDDDGAELAKTMAALDTSLRRLEGAYDSFSNCRLTSLVELTNGLFSRA